MTFRPSPQQQQYFDWIQNAQGSALLEAVAGSGKTTTLIQGLSLMKGDIFFGAYNKKIAEEIAAALFALFLGGLGVHKFYLGQAGQGIIYILFCWTFIPLFFAFIEGLILLTMSEKEFVRKFGTS